MNKVVVGVMGLLLASTTIVFADGVVIPGSIKVEAFKREMSERGMDLSGGDDADGVIENYGTKIKVITYKPVTLEQMELMREVAIKTVRE